MQRGADRCGRVRIDESCCRRTWATIRIVCARTRINVHASVMLHAYYYACGWMFNIAEAVGPIAKDYPRRPVPIRTLPHHSTSVRIDFRKINSAN